ncbi:MAG: hypothetical protein AB1422_16225 [bacterium]
MKRLLLSFSLLIIPGINLSAQGTVTLEHADHAEYLKIGSEEIVTLWGSVKLNSDEMGLEADWMQLNLTKDELLARGKVVLRGEKGEKFESNEANYNLKTKQGKMKEPYIFIKPYYCRGSDALFETGTITLRDASLTTCDLPRPHYCLKAGKIIVHPKEKIIAKRIVFKVGKVPLFYLPFYSMSLKERKGKIIMKTGKSEEKGNSVGVTYDYAFTSKSIGSLHLSFLEDQGFGNGIEHKYWKDSISQGKTYLYYIHERKKPDDVKDTKRWEIDAKHLQRFKDITGILYLQSLSDKNVTRDYPIEGRCSAGTWELKNYLTVTKTYPDYTIRLVGEEIECWAREFNDFKKETTLLPELTLQTKSIKRNNWYSNLNVEVANQSGSMTNTHYLKGIVGVNFLKKANFLSDRVVFSPKFGLTGIVKEEEKATGELNLGLNLRNKIGGYSELNLNHNLTKKFKTDEYYGVKTNALTGTLYLWMNRKIRGEIGAGFDLRKHKDEPLKINKIRLFPLIADVHFALKNNLAGSLKTTYSFKSSQIEEVESYFDLARDKWQYGGSVFFYREHSVENKDILDVSNYVSFNISPKTHIRLQMYYDLKDRRIKESGLILEKDGHCWNAKFSVRHSKDTEFWLNFNLK